MAFFTQELLLVVLNDSIEKVKTVFVLGVVRKPAGSLQTRKNKSIVQQTLFVCTGYNIMQRRSTVKLISVDVVVILLGRDSQQCLYQDQMTLERRT